jgi:hypothetical protein
MDFLLSAFDLQHQAGLVKSVCGFQKCRELRLSERESSQEEEGNQRRETWQGREVQQTLEAGLPAIRRWSVS